MDARYTIGGFAVTVALWQHYSIYRVFLHDNASHASGCSCIATFGFVPSAGLVEQTVEEFLDSYPDRPDHPAN